MGTAGGLAFERGFRVDRGNGNRSIVDALQVTQASLATVFQAGFGPGARGIGALGPGGLPDGAVQGGREIAGFMEEAFDPAVFGLVVAFQPLGQASAGRGPVPGDATAELVQLAAGVHEIGLGALEAGQGDLVPELPVGGDKGGLGLVLPELESEESESLFEVPAIPFGEPLDLEHEATERLLLVFGDSRHGRLLGAKLR